MDVGIFVRIGPDDLGCTGDELSELVREPPDMLAVQYRTVLFSDFCQQIIIVNLEWGKNAYE